MPTGCDNCQSRPPCHFQAVVPAALGAARAHHQIRQTVASLSARPFHRPWRKPSRRFSVAHWAYRPTGEVGNLSQEGGRKWRRETRRLDQAACPQLLEHRSAHSVRSEERRAGAAWMRAMGVEDPVIFPGSLAELDPRDRRGTGEGGSRDSPGQAQPARRLSSTVTAGRPLTPMEVVAAVAGPPSFEHEVAQPLARSVPALELTCLLRQQIGDIGAGRPVEVGVDYSGHPVAEMPLQHGVVSAPGHEHLVDRGPRQPGTATRP